MGKRSDFPRVERDYYVTPAAAVQPLLPCFEPDEITLFVEPCAGDGSLIDHLEASKLLRCCAAWDLEPRRAGIKRGNAMTMDPPPQAEVFITNPPHRRDLLLPLIDRLATQLPTYLLLPADWMHNKYSIPYLPWLRSIHSIGRVKWIPGSPYVGKENYAWYMFDRLRKPARYAYFFGRKNDA